MKIQINSMLWLFLCGLIFYCDGLQTPVKVTSQSKCNDYSQQANNFPKSNSKNPIEFPHLAFIGSAGSYNEITWQCAGVLISENYVLFAAHCANRDPLAFVQLIGQTSSLDNKGNSTGAYNVQEIIRNPEYARSSVYNDIALIKLDKTVVFSADVRPACLWQTYNLNTTTAIETKWNINTASTDSPISINPIDVTLVDNQICTKNYVNVTKVFKGVVNENICFQESSTQVQSQNLSSYGPGAVQIRRSLENSFIYDVIGVVSFGNRFDDKLAVFTRVASYLEWIESVVWP